MLADQGTDRTAVFRFDASPTMGGGHAFRCLTLADALRKENWACQFVVGDETIAAVPRLQQGQFDCLELNQQADDGSETVCRWLANKPCHLLIVDHYGLDNTFETACRGFSEQILVIDDLADRRHDCDFILDQTYGRSQEAYAGLVPLGCRFFLGADYALLKPEYAAQREVSLNRRARTPTLKKILISVGLTDPLGLSAQILDQLGPIEGLEIDIVLGGGVSDLDSVRTMVAAMGERVQLHVDIENMSELMMAADLSVGGCGTTSWERCCVGVPTLGMIVADNQRLIADNLSRIGAIDIISDVDSVRQHVEALMNDPDRLNRMSAAAASVCDGLGSSRIVNELTR